MRFSFLFFSQMLSQDNSNPYQLLTDLTKFGDENGFEAVWLPERHFSPVGGSYANPAVIAASLAVQTQNIRLRSGSVVLPLHHPADVVEQWSIVDNLSSGRVDLGVASGWDVDDFVLCPETYENLRQTWLDRIGTVKSLWRGDKSTFANGKGDAVDITVYPRPVQKELNLWLAVSRKTESFKLAGEMGANVLTMLSGINLAQLAKKIEVYRKAREAAGYDPSTGVVSLMMHTYVHKDMASVDKVVRTHFMQYIKGTLSSHLKGGAVGSDKKLSPRDIEKMAEYSYHRYVKTGTLFGDVQQAGIMVEKTTAVGVDEIACMMDFGPDSTEIADSLYYLNQLKNQYR
jgi:natural product biosynthesis luciferase-like monooxygenase protein